MDIPDVLRKVCLLVFIVSSSLHAHIFRSLKELRKTRGIKPAHLRPVAYSEQDGGTELAERKEHETIADVLSRKSQKNIVLLVNEGTASSAEVFVSSLRDNGRVTLIGTRTFGKVRKTQSVNWHVNPAAADRQCRQGLIQHTFPLGDGGGEIPAMHFFCRFVPNKLPNCNDELN